MTLPEPHEWECVRTGARTPHESLSDACRRLYRYADDWLDTLIASEGMDGVIEDERIRDEVAAIDAFLSACRAAGLDK